VNRLFQVMPPTRCRSTTVAVIAAGLVLAVAVLGGTGQAWGPTAPHTPAAARTPWPGGTWQPDPAAYGVGADTGMPVRLAQDPYLCQTSEGAAEVLGGSNGLATSSSAATTT
jgi:hypothetical protein